MSDAYGSGDYSLVPVEHDPFADVGASMARHLTGNPGAGPGPNPAQAVLDWRNSGQSWADQYHDYAQRAAGQDTQGAIQAAGNPMDLFGGFVGSTTPATGAAERITAAAIRTSEGKILTGSSHLEIADNLDLDSLHGAEDGFVTNTGRYVSRDEAAQISNYTGNLRFESSKIPPSITAYHGSPYDFSKFDMSKIGTGEGAQAYGHGLYFAEEPQVAEQYKSALAAKQTVKNQFQVTKEATADLGDDMKYPVWAVLQQLQSGKSLSDVRSALLADPLAGRRPLSDINNAIDWVTKNHPEYAANPGKMYQVSIAADPEHFLDWDKPLSEQHPEVQQKLKDAWLAHPDLNQDLNDWHNTLRSWEPEVSIAAARQAGIPGIKYLDQGSRGVDVGKAQARLSEVQDQITNVHARWGDQAPLRLPQLKQEEAQLQDAIKRGSSPTSNYVVFDDKLIDIIKKYGIAGLIAGGASHFSTQQVNHDPFASGMAQGGRVGRKARVAAILQRHGIAA